MTATVVIPAQRDGTAAGRWELVTRAQAGDPDAWDALYRLYQPAVHAFILRRTSGNRHLAEDLTHDVFVRAIRSIGSVSWQGRDPAAWLIVVARNLTADYYKSGRHRYEAPARFTSIGTLAGDGDATDMVDRVDDDRRCDPVQVAVHDDLSAALDAALPLLTDAERDVLALRFGAGLSIDETAAALGKKAGAVKAAQYRATQALRRHLTAAGVGPC